MFSSFRRRRSTHEKADKAAAAQCEAATQGKSSSRNLLRIRSWQAFSKRLVCATNVNNKEPTTNNVAEYCHSSPVKSHSSWRKGRSSKLLSPLRKSKSLDVEAPDIPDFIMCGDLDTKDEDEDDDIDQDDDDDDDCSSFDENIDYDFEDSTTFNSYRSIMDDLSFEMYEDPYLDVLTKGSHSGKNTDHQQPIDECFDEVDIHTPLPSQAMHASSSSSPGALFKMVRNTSFDDEDEDEDDCEPPPEAEPCSSGESRATSGPSSSITTADQPQSLSSSSPLKDIHVVFDDCADDLTTSGFMVSHSSNLYSITEFGDDHDDMVDNDNIVEIENIVNPFASDPSHYFSQSAKAAAMERQQETHESSSAGLCSATTASMTSAAHSSGDVQHHHVSSSASTDKTSRVTLEVSQSAAMTSPHKIKMEALQKLNTLSSPTKSKHASLRQETLLLASSYDSPKKAVIQQQAAAPVSPSKMRSPVAAPHFFL